MVLLKDNEYKIERVIELHPGGIESIWYVINQKKKFLFFSYWKRLEVNIEGGKEIIVFQDYQGAISYLKQTRPYAIILSPIERDLETITYKLDPQSVTSNIESKGPLYLYQLDTRLPNGDYWVIATDPTTAQQKLEKILDEADYGYTDQRKVERIQVIAKGITDTRFIQDKKLIL